MDCASEEQLIRMKLQDFAEITALEFDLSSRTLSAFHVGSHAPILRALETLNMNAAFRSTEESESAIEPKSGSGQRKLLWTVLAINFLFFVLEMTFGIISHSMALVADSLDMLADSLVYAMALFAVGGTVARKKNVAKFAGYFQILLATIGFMEVVRRFFGFEEMPDFQTMIVVSMLALGANVLCLYLMYKQKSGEAHMRASMIFTSNDVIINSGVIVAGLLVLWLNSGYPDLIVGAIVFLVVAQGAYRILKLAR